MGGFLVYPGKGNERVCGALVGAIEMRIVQIVKSSVVRDQLLAPALTSSRLLAKPKIVAEQFLVHY